MKRSVRSILATVAILPLSLALQGALRAQDYTVSAQMSSQLHGDGTYDYTIELHNDSSSLLSINTFWFAWVPYSYGYDLLPSNPTVTQAPSGWYNYVFNNSYYYPDGYSIEFNNYYGQALDPGQTFTFGFNSPDSPDTLSQQSPYYYAPTLTSFAYNSSPGYDPGAQFVVEIAPVPEPSALALFALSAIGISLGRRQNRPAL
jgi:hypothetical protein